MPDDESHLVSISNVLCVHDLSCGLYSVNQATDRGFAICFFDDQCHILKGSQIVGVATKGTNYSLGMTHATSNIKTSITLAMQALVATAMYSPEAMELWHRRLGHLNEADLKRLTGMSNGITLSIKPRLKSQCGPCARGKHARKQSRTVHLEVTEKLAMLHLDTGGPLHITGVGGARFYRTDQATGTTWSFTFNNKDDICQIFTNCKVQIETQSGCKRMGERET